MATTDEIKSWLDRADAAEAEVEDLRWKAAEALSLAHKAGRKQKQLAAAIGRDQSTVSKYIWCWDHHGQPPRKPWAEAWREVTNNKRAPSSRASGSRSTTSKSRSSQVAEDQNSRGNNSGPLDQGADFLRTTGELIILDPEEAARSAVVTSDNWATYREWATELGRWAMEFVKRLDAVYDPALEDQ